MGSTSKVVTANRGYTSPHRSAQARRTRERILTAAAARFRANGYTGTTMRAVAADAQVAVPTVELAFGTKASLLKAAIDTATAGDDEPVPMLNREWAARAQAATDATGFLVVFADVLADSAQRAAGLVLAALEAARRDPEIAAVAAQLAAQREQMAAWLVDGLTRRSPLRADISHAAAIDTVWVLMDPAVFCRLTSDRGWTARRFQRWFTDSIAHLLLPAHAHVPATTVS